MLGVFRICLARSKSETHSRLKIHVSGRKNCLFLETYAHTKQLPCLGRTGLPSALL